MLLEMEKMNFIESLSFSPLDLTNGKLVDYKITLKSTVHLDDEDKLFITFPEEVGVDNSVACSPLEPPEGPQGVDEVDCRKVSDNSLVAELVQVSEKTGEFSFLVRGIRNPPSFRRSGLSSNIKVTTSENYNIEELKKEQY